jgi:hypothetical protein
MKMKFKLTQLSEFKLHSIEQPIQKIILTGWQSCAKPVLSCCVRRRVDWRIWYAGKEQLLTKIKPQYIILKPSLWVVFGTQEWISLAEKHRVVDNLSFGE